MYEGIKDRSGLAYLTISRPDKTCVEVDVIYAFSLCSLLGCHVLDSEIFEVFSWKGDIRVEEMFTDPSWAPCSMIEGQL